MKKIKYIGFYDSIKRKDEKRNYVLSAVNKMDYIASSINKNGIDVQFISPSWTYNPKYYSESHTQINENIELILSPTLPWRGKISKLVSIIFSNVWLLWFILKNTKKNECIIVYHSLWLIIPLYITKKIKKIRVILEVEEIYADAKKINMLIKKMEKNIIENADGYIFSTEMLNEKINKKNKPYTTIYGTYKSEDNKKEHIDDGRIHIVYAGTFDKRKGGAITAVNTAKYLDENYHIHIIGFGSKYEKELLENLITDVCQNTACKVTYDGLYKGEDYIRFLQKCDIGLSTQIPEAKYNDTSFPSKVLSYMANGLRVISIKIKVLERSNISDLLFYYDKDSPSEVAQIIKRIDLLEKYDSRSRIEELNKTFIDDIKNLLDVII